MIGGSRRGTSKPGRAAGLAIGLALAMWAAPGAAAAGTVATGCGDADASGGMVTATDALIVLRASIGLAQCEECVCDVDANLRVSATDALAILAAAVGTGGQLACGACAPVSCGDGVAEGQEECDDGNRRSGDGCSRVCELQDVSAVCAGVPTVAGTAITAELVAAGLSRPIGIESAPLDPHRLFVVEQTGSIRVIRDDSLLATPFLDLTGKITSGGERGLLGLAFHPDFESNGRFFVNYTDVDGNTVVARFLADPTSDAADPTSETVLLQVDQPFSNHNGGQLAFGPDGRLYVGLGDGGDAGDPNDYARNDLSLLGKMLRLDVDGIEPVGVPEDNPSPGAGFPLGLVWAKGLRNPWRFAFDRASGDLYIADVGQAAIEEIDYQPAASTGGENYGWDVFEGSACFEPITPPSCPDPATAYTFPIHEYSHDEGCSITGGYVYRGCTMPDLRGTYFYGDYCGDFVKTLRVTDGVAGEHADRTAELAAGTSVPITRIVSFGEDARGELYIALIGGSVLRIVHATAP